MSTPVEAALPSKPLAAQALKKYRYWQRILNQLRIGSLVVHFPDGVRLSITGEAEGPQAVLEIHAPLRLLWKLAHSGDLGFGEAYMQGYWSTPDLSTLLYLLCMNLEAFATQERKPLLMRAWHRWQHASNRNSLRGSRRNIMRHYDLGNDFYQRWLDRSMSYSSALFYHSMDLEAAQRCKYAVLFARLEAKPGQRLLEIGCGWGGFLEYAAQQGCEVVGLTLSPSQQQYAQQRLQKTGLDSQVDIRLQDYRDLNEKFDHVVSIEMFEAVGQQWWPRYFEVVHECLKPGGRAALQIITIDSLYFDEYVETAGGFIQKYIFPGGMLPTQQHLLQLAQSQDLDCLELDCFGDHYSDTLAQWRENFNAESEWLEQQGYDARFRRMWNYYLAFCEAGFREGRIDLVHLLLSRSGYDV